MNEILKYFPDINPEQTNKFQDFYSVYELWNSKINLISRKDFENLYIHHILHSLSILKFIEFKNGTKVLDVGTGGGFPGVPLAILFPEVEFTLIDGIGKKILAVNSIIRDLKINNAKGINIRAEDLSEKSDFILARAVGSLDKFYPLIQKNISSNSFNDMNNGLIYLKGGDLSHELRQIKHYKEVLISDYFNEPFFKDKKIIYIPITP
ncbi:MAG: 16S rRNA (guanine(527)-N(7))-methyltransferase RsmG [Bacteroidota bacterium]|nr:16S rRNA (guanine(527)-N(7))-methyltransferase RsmG [Bacteroidota bacterium]